ncbi:MAG: hypothetical protein AAFQ95_25955 [Cyanobacteria bacterium J06621_3]
MKAIKFETIINNRYEIHLKLPENVKVGRAEVIVMFDDDEDPLVRSSDVENAAKPPRKFGQFRGQIQVADDFDAPLPDEFWLGEN